MSLNFNNLLLKIGIIVEIKYFTLISFEFENFFNKYTKFQILYVIYSRINFINFGNLFDEIPPIPLYSESISKNNSKDPFIIIFEKC